MTTTSNTTLELRNVAIPRSPLVERLEQTFGRLPTHETRHYLADRPVHCGDMLELYLDGQWVVGRYEWTGKPEELPTFEYDGGVRRIDAECLVRWP